MEQQDKFNNAEDSEFSKQFYKIRDVADFVGVPATTLRYWESQFPEFIAPIRNPGKIRYYTPENIRTLRLIKFLLHERGMKMEAIREELRQNRSNVSKRLKILTKLTEVRSELAGLQKALLKRRDI